MLANNDQKVIRRLSLRSMRADRKRYGTFLAAAAIASFLLFCVLTIGLTYLELLKLQTIRINGADYDIQLINGFTREQKEKLMKDEHVSSVGVFAYAGYVEKTDADDTVHTGLIYYDDVFWKEQKSRAVDKESGHYPQKSNELMVTREALADCGKGELDVGDSFVMTYSDRRGSHEEEFVISGIWEGFGGKEVFCVSEAFYRESGYELSGNAGLFVKLKGRFVTKRTLAMLEESVGKTDRQIFYVNSDTENSAYALAGTAGLGFIICLSAYLLIYNIFYLSVAGKVRYYGLLQALGMTKRQVRRLVMGQMILIGAAGILFGTLAGAGVSFGLVPYVMKLLGIKAGNMEIRFHPAVLFVSILVVGCTLYLSVRKPALAASCITPVEALAYQGYVSAERKRKKTGRGSWCQRMAAGQLRKDKKKTAVVFLSLAASLSVYLCLTTIIGTQGARTVYPNHMDADIVIRNDTAGLEDTEAFRPIIGDTFVEELCQIEGIRKIHILSGVQAEIPRENEFLSVWLERYNALQSGNSAIESSRQDYRAWICGIDEAELDYLNQSLDEPVDKEDFLSGKKCLVYHSGVEFSEEELGQMTVRFREEGTEKYQETGVAGMVYEGYYGFSGGPGIIMSGEYLASACEETDILSLNVMYDKEYDEETERAVRTLINTDENASDFYCESKYDNMQEIRAAQSGRMEVGSCIAILLLLVGILNYINTVSAGIQNRRRSLAVMESLGMSRRQVRELLVREGMLYAGGSMAVTFTAGMLVTYSLFQSMNSMGAPFRIPLAYLAAAMVLVCLACILIPLLTYRYMDQKESLAERIRGFE